MDTFSGGQTLFLRQTAVLTSDQICIIFCLARMQMIPSFHIALFDMFSYGPPFPGLLYAIAERQADSST